MYISIHTTAKVVTNSMFYTIGEGEFQSTPPRRWWPSYKSFFGPISWFQSTPPRRWWPIVLTVIRSFQHFNPHHREGGDPDNRNECDQYPISIHTTAKVVTAKSPKFHSHFCIKLLINRLFHTNLTTPFPSIPPFSITQHPKIWCESPNVFLFTSYSH